MVDVAEIREKIRILIEKGPVLSTKPDVEKKNDGAVGNTFEREMDVPENSRPGPDYKQWEFKSKRLLSKTAASLFTVKPNHPINGDQYMRENWGVPDTENEYPHIKVLRTSVFVNQYREYYPEKIRLRASIDDSSVDDPKRKFRIKRFDANDNVIDDSVYWDLCCIKKSAEAKLRNTLFVEADETQTAGQVYFQYKTAIAYIDFNFDKFLNCLQEGKIRYEHRLGIYRSGAKKGREHNHGGGFRLNKPVDFYKIFDRVEELYK
jgi:hypothetical protein